MFLHFHPEIGFMNSPLVEKLSTKPVLMIGYCRIPCDFLEFSVEDQFKRDVPETVQLMYLGRDFSKSADLSPIMKAEEAFNRLHRLYEVPLGAQYIPEIVAFGFLLILQCFIVVRICQKRSVAK